MFPFFLILQLLKTNPNHPSLINLLGTTPAAACDFPAEKGEKWPKPANVSCFKREYILVQIFLGSKVASQGRKGLHHRTLADIDDIANCLCIDSVLGFRSHKMDPRFLLALVFILKNFVSSPLIN